MIRAIIIDDEFNSRKNLKSLLNKHCSEVEIIAEADSVESGLKVIRESDFELLFLDINLTIGSGFDILESLKKIDFDIIFITAYDQYAIKAIKFSAMDYLLKPIDIDELIGSVEKAKEKRYALTNEKKIDNLLRNFKSQRSSLEQIALPTVEGFEFITVADIIYLKADGNYTRIFIENSENKMASKNIGEWESLLCGDSFCRVHNSFLININKIKKYVKGEGGYLIMKDDSIVEVSRRKKQDVLNLFNRR